MMMFRRLSDQKVIEKIREGDESALVYLYKDHYTMVRNFVLKNNGNDDVVEDILQESVLAVWKNVQRSEFLLQAKLSTYVMSIAKNLWFKELKKQSRFTYVDENEKIDYNVEEIQNNWDHHLIVKMVGEMDDTCRKLLSYFYFDGFDNNVIANKLGFSNSNSVKSKKYQCFKRLQKLVLENYNKEDLL